MDGIVEYWSGGEIDEKKVEVVLVDLNDGGYHYYSKGEQKSNDINITPPVEGTGPRTKIKGYDTKYTIIPTGDRRKNSVYDLNQEQFKNMAAHEYGHLLGIGDGLGYGSNGVTTKGNVKSLMANQWGVTKATTVDYALMLESYRTQSFIKWEGKKNIGIIRKYMDKNDKIN